MKRTYLGDATTSSMFTRKNHPNSYPRTHPTMDESDTSKGTTSSSSGSMMISEAEHMQSLPNLPPQQTNITPKMADALLAETMNQLSIEERQRVYEDIHGVSDNPIIDMEDNELKGGGPRFVLQSLQQLNDEIRNNIPETNKHAYIMACEQNLEYVMSLRIMFLRSEVYNISHAAIRMCAFFQFKSDLFGSEILGRDILWSDLNQTDIECLETGYMQILPGRDRSGRSLFFVNRGNTTQEQVRFRNMPVDSRLRITMYFIMKMLQDVNTQKYGIISISYDAGPRKKELMNNDKEYTWRSGKLISVLPFRVMSMHYCYQDPLVDMLLALARVVLGARTRARLRPHCGQHLELVYELMSFGIPPDLLPIEIRGQECVTTTKHHKLFLERLKREDEETLLYLRQQQQQMLLQQLEPIELFDDQNLPDLSQALLSAPLDDDDLDFGLDNNDGVDDNNNPTFVSSNDLSDVFFADVQPQLKATNILLRDIASIEKNRTEPSELPKSDHPANRVGEEKKKTNAVKTQEQDHEQRVLEPNDSDVLLGRGNIGVHKANPGNVRFQQLMDKYEDQYESEDRFGKTVVAGMIVNAIKEGNGRFLRQDENGWVVITDNVARTRVGHNFRNRRIKRMKQTKKNGKNGGATGKGNDNSSILSSSFDQSTCNLFQNCGGFGQAT